MTWIWLAPNPTDFISGGNIYNQKMVQALCHINEDARIVPFPFNETQVPKPHEIIIWDTFYILQLIKSEEIQRESIILLVHMVSRDVLQNLPQILHKIKGFLVTSQWAAGQLIACGVSNDLIAVIEPGLDRMPMISDHQTPLEKLHLIQVANLVPEKGHEALLLKIKSHPERMVDLQLDLYGDDRINPAWAKYISSLADNNNKSPIVQFKGRVSHSKIYDTMNSYHALLSVSPQESFGMAIQEAVSIGLPVLAIRGGHIPRLVQHGINGYLFEDVSGVISWLARPFKKKMDLLDQVKRRSSSLADQPGWAEQAVLFRNSLRRFIS